MNTIQVQNKFKHLQPDIRYYTTNKARVKFYPIIRYNIIQHEYTHNAAVKRLLFYTKIKITELEMLDR